MISIFSKKKLSLNYVDLSIGRVYFYEITHGMLNKITRKSTIIGNTLNNAYFLELFEYELVNLSKRKIQNLSKNDGDKLRYKLKEILIKHDILKSEQEPEKEANIFSKNEVEWFNKSQNQIISKFGGKIHG